MARRLHYFPMLVNEIKRHFGSISRSAAVAESQIEDFGDDLGFPRRSLSVSPISSRSGSFSESGNNTNNTNTNNNSNNPSALPYWWFTCKFNENDLIVPLHLPIGLIYDLISALKGGEKALPWKLEFHLSHTPSIIQTSNSSVLKSVISYTPTPFLDEPSLVSIYFSALKEADHLRSGSAKNVMNLTRSEQLQLWDALKGGECDRFWRINQKLISCNPKSIPIKFWFIATDEIVARFQFPVADLSVNLKILLESEFPDQFDRIKTALLHGVSLPFTVTLEELNYNWNYADNFLQIILIVDK